MHRFLKDDYQVKSTINALFVIHTYAVLGRVDFEVTHYDKHGSLPTGAKNSFLIHFDIFGEHFEVHLWRNRYFLRIGIHAHTSDLNRGRGAQFSVTETICECFYA